jgi:restriction system protein
MGYRTRVSPEGLDKGIDIVAFRDELGLHPPIIRVQVKSGEGNVGAPEVQALAAAIGDKGAGLFVALASFSKQARDFADAKGNIRLLDGDALLDPPLEHREALRQAAAHSCASGRPGIA